MTEQTIPQILRAAAQAVRDRGLAKGIRHVVSPYSTYGGPYARIGSVCALGAIEIALDPKWTNERYLENYPEGVRAAAALAEHLTGNSHVGSRVANWNNRPERTPDEVIATFEAAAACEEQKERKQG